MENTHAQYKALLAEEKKRLEDELSRLGRKLNDNGDWVATPEEDDGFRADVNENADNIERFEGRVATLTELEKRYSEILAALDRIEQGTYGVCEVSGEPIEAERLQANPAARTCIEHLNE